MIVSHLRQFLYFGPPKTATTSLHRWLSQPLFCRRRWTPAQGDQHAARVLAGCEEYFRFASIRHPLDREVSLWAHSQSRASREQGTPALTFCEFVAWQPTASWFYRTGQAEILRGVRLDAVVRFDRLAEDLAGLPPIAPLILGYPGFEPLERLNCQGEQPPWRTHYEAHPGLAEAVAERFAADVDLYRRWNGGEKAEGNPCGP